VATELEVTLHDVALFVQCPVCNACDFGEEVGGCWDEDGRERVPIHAERLEVAEKLLGENRYEDMTEPPLPAHIHRWSATGTVDTGHDPPRREYQCRCGEHIWWSGDDGPSDGDV
jgi:hypothetical protein